MCLLVLLFIFALDRTSVEREYVCVLLILQQVRFLRLDVVVSFTVPNQARVIIMRRVFIFMP